MRATQAIIHVSRLRENMQAIRNKVGKNRAICIPVKADAYGHGAVQIALEVLRCGASCLAVASVREAIELRESGIEAPVLLLSVPSPEEIPEAVANKISMLAADMDFLVLVAAAAQKAGKPVSLHIKIDTGMGRIGCRPENAVLLADFIEKTALLKLEGCASHLAVADSTDPADMAYTRKQLDIFFDAVDSIRKAGINPGILHTANSGAVVLHEESLLDMVRPGLLLYGYPPVAALETSVPVKPLMELRTEISFIKEVYAGESISYGRIWTAGKTTRIATLPLGYADGLPRALSGTTLPSLSDSKRWSVSAGSIRCPIAGRICMDQTMIDIGIDSDIKRWDTVSVFGGNTEKSSAADMAALLGTIPYEICCGINKRVPRIYV